jgi:hypothetical protein
MFALPSSEKAKSGSDPFTELSNQTCTTEFIRSSAKETQSLGRAWESVGERAEGVSKTHGDLSKDVQRREVVQEGLA